MPTYEYKREDGSTFEVLQQMSDDPLTKCPTTGQPVRRIISGGSGVLLKGSGWYVTDYKNGKSKNGTLITGSAEKPASSGSSEKPTSDKKE